MNTVLKLLIKSQNVMPEKDVRDFDTLVQKIEKNKSAKKDEEKVLLNE